jgi:hypothetical protein
MVTKQGKKSVRLDEEEIKETSQPKMSEMPLGDICTNWKGFNR